MSEEVLQITGERREAKSKVERDRYAHLNAEFQRKARRNKKGFLNQQCKDIEENERMGKTRDLFRKIGASKGTFHARMGTIKDRNSKDQREAEETKKRWQEYTEELYKTHYWTLHCTPERRNPAPPTRTQTQLLNQETLTSH